jgi:hypothetical protein
MAENSRRIKVPTHTLGFGLSLTLPWSFPAGFLPPLHAQVEIDPQHDQGQAEAP